MATSQAFSVFLHSSVSFQSHHQTSAPNIHYDYITSFGNIHHILKHCRIKQNSKWYNGFKGQVFFDFPIFFIALNATTHMMSIIMFYINIILIIIP